MLRFFGRLVIGLFAAIGLVAALALIAGGVVAWKLAAREPGVASAMILTVDLNGGLVDGPSEDTASRLLFGSKTTLRDLVEALERAGEDPRVKGLYVRLGEDSLGVAKVQQVRDSVRAFRAKGKFAIAFAESFGELGPGTRPYYLATAFDEIWLQPLGDVGLTGLRAEVPFVRGALDRLGIEARFDHRSEYKSAMNTLTDTQMTGPQREETGALLNSVQGQIVAGIAEARQLTPQAVEALIDRGPFLADDAKNERIVDRIGYRDEAVARAHERAGSGAELTSLSRYLRGAGRPHNSGPTIALIYGTGLITRGGGSSTPLAGDDDATAAKLTRAFRDAFRDPAVRAIVLRIDSPGGSAVASETIWREVLRARERGKPVIASMGDTAASGGYYIAAPADKIVAEPATITGSIGVLAGKLVVAGLFRKIGISVDSEQRGANAGMFSATQDFSPAEWQRLESFLDETYRGFKQHVAAGRHLSADAVEAVAKGRVWSGEDAKAKGLVDELGGYDTAFRLAKEAAQIPADGPFKIVVYPHEKDTLDRLADRLLDKDSDSNSGGSATVERVLGGLRAVAGQIDAWYGDSGLLRMPPIGELR
jgi:protease-4